MTGLEEITSLLEGYLAEPGNSGLYIVQAGQPARNVSVEKTAKGIRLVAGQGFWHAAVQRDPLDLEGAKRLEACSR
jgi:hypothetical protein